MSAATLDLGRARTGRCRELFTTSLFDFLLLVACPIASALFGGWDRLFRARFSVVRMLLCDASFGNRMSK
jgi:hypothetical protein